MHRRRQGKAVTCRGWYRLKGQLSDKCCHSLPLTLWSPTKLQYLPLKLMYKGRQNTQSSNKIYLIIFQISGRRKEEQKLPTPAKENNYDVQSKLFKPGCQKLPVRFLSTCTILKHHGSALPQLRSAKIQQTGSTNKF